MRIEPPSILLHPILTQSPDPVLDQARPITQHLSQPRQPTRSSGTRPTKLPSLRPPRRAHQLHQIPIPLIRPRDIQPSPPPHRSLSKPVRLIKRADIEIQPAAHIRRNRPDGARKHQCHPVLSLLRSRRRAPERVLWLRRIRLAQARLGKCPDARRDASPSLWSRRTR